MKIILAIILSLTLCDFAYAQAFVSKTFQCPDKYTVALIKSDGTTIRDYSCKDSSGNARAPRSFTNYNSNAVASTANVRFRKAMYFGGNGSLVFPDSDDWYISGDYTVEMWINFQAEPTYQVLHGQLNAAQEYFYFWVGHQGYSGYQTGINGYLLPFTPSFDAVITSSWQHLALVYSNANLTCKVYSNGVYLGTYTFDSLQNITADFVFGSWGTNDYYITAYVDGLKISKGIQRYTSDFTPPTREF